MVVIILPKWVTPLENKIDNLIRDLCNKENINYGFVQDSTFIKDAKEIIIMTLFNIQEKAEGNVPDEFHKEFKKSLKKDKKKR